MEGTRWRSTDPTYKEWKHSRRIGYSPKFGIVHGSYLQGMETCEGLKNLFRVRGHGSYLQGMETRVRAPASPLRGLRTDPTYKEWKPVQCFTQAAPTVPARILPTRNGNVDFMGYPDDQFRTHGSYLQGMETTKYALFCAASVAARILPTRNGNIAIKPTTIRNVMHGSYLQGMETAPQRKIAAPGG